MARIQIFVLAITLFVNACTATKPSLYQYHNLPAETNQDSSICICLPKSENAQMLSDMIDSQGLGLERLVIYFYINPQTYEITAYTPNIEKQTIFPDMPFDNSDTLVPLRFDDDINSIVILNPNKVVKTQVGQQNINYLMFDGNPSGPNTNVPNILNTGEAQSIDLPKAGNIPVFKPLEEVYQEAVNEIIPPEKKLETHIQPDTNIVITDNINQQKVMGQNIVNQLRPTQEPVKTLQNINQAPPNNILDGWQTESNIFKLDNYVLNNNDHQPATDIQSVQKPGYTQFDQWFQQQMASPLNKQNSVNSPDDDVLKSLVYKNLFQRGIIFMDNGVLKTHQGDMLNLSNLKLQPILVGLSLDYNYPTAGIRSKIVPPYYDALALYMNHSSKILDIIPMSTDYSADSMGYTTMNVNKIIPNMVSSTILKTQCVNGKCHTSTEAKDFPLRSGRPEKERPHEDAELYGRSAQGTDKDVVQIYRGNRNQLGILNIEQLENNSVKNKSKRIPLATDVLSKLYNILLGEKAGIKIGKKTPIHEVRTTEDEGLDIRIVGGSAATGSGTPVSSRGRSAFD